MVETLWDRLGEVLGQQPLKVTRLKAVLGVSYQAAKKVKEGGGLNRDNVLLICGKYGLNPDWLVSGKGPRNAASKIPPPAPPAAPSGPFDAITEEERELLDDFRRLLDTDREHYRVEIRAKAFAMREHLEKYLKQIGGHKTEGGR